MRRSSVSTAMRPWMWWLNSMRSALAGDLFWLRLGRGGRTRTAAETDRRGWRHADPRAELLRRHQLSRRRLALAGPAWRKRVDKGVALLSQSSNIVINMTMQKRALPAPMSPYGNAAVVDWRNWRGALLADERVTAIASMSKALMMRRICRTCETARAAARACGHQVRQDGSFAHRCPIAYGITGGGGAASSAFLKRIGVAEVNSPSELMKP